MPECFVCRRISNRFNVHAGCISNLEGVFTGYKYTKEAKQILKIIKYQGAFRLIKPLLSGLKDHSNRYLLSLSVQKTILVPIPLHLIKYNERGFNQAELIAKEISRSTGIPVLSNILARRRYTKPQSSLLGRKKNVQGAFRVKKIPPVNNIILVDDVITSGSTLEEAAKTIKKRYPKVNIYGYCVFSGLRKRRDKIRNQSAINA